MTVYDAKSDKCRAGLAYAAKGIPIFPCKEKTPLVKGGHKSATTDPERIRRWWERHPNANIAAPTGKRSGFWVLDADAKHDGAEKVRELEAELGELPTTATQKTGGGGLQYFFSWPEGGEIRNSAGKLAPGVDVRGEGGYVVLPPSQTTGDYEWLERTPPQPAPQAWVEAATNITNGTEDGYRERRERPRNSKPFDDGGPIGEGGRNDALTRIGGRLRAKGWEYEDIRDALLTANIERCSPPLPPAEVIAVAKSVCRYAPGKSGPTPDVIETLAEMHRRIDGSRWPSMGGESARDALLQLAVAAEKYGRAHEDGVWVSMSMRQLSLRAAMSLKAAQKAVKRLEEWGWIKPDREHASGTKAGAFVLLKTGGDNHPPGRAKGTHSNQGFLHRSVSASTERPKRSSVYPLRAPLTSPRLRWSGGGFKRLGKSSGHVIDLLEQHGRLSLEELADALGMRRPRDLRRKGGKLMRLVEAGVVVPVEGGYELSDSWLETVNERREADGEIEALRRDVKRYREQREKMQVALRITPDQAPSVEEMRQNTERMRERRRARMPEHARNRLAKVAEGERYVNPHKERISAEEQMQRAYEWMIEERAAKLDEVFRDLDRRRKKRRAA